MNLLSRLAITVCAPAALALPAVAAAVAWPDVSSSISATQTGGPFISPSGSDDLWVTPLQWTNTGATALSDTQFVDTEAWACVAGSCTGSGPDGTSNLTWNNSLDEWQLLGATGAVLGTVQAANSDFSLSLSPTSTNIPIPSGFGLSASDSVPAFLIGDLAPGASVNTQVNFLASTNIDTLYFSGSEVASSGASVPEPGTLALIAAGLIPLCLRRSSRRRWSTRCR